MIRTYPRVSRTRKTPDKGKGSNSQCLLCEAPSRATHIVTVETNCMRGDDDVMKLCDEHAGRLSRNDWCGLYEAREAK